MGKPDKAPPVQATGVVPSEARLPEPMYIPSGPGGMPEPPFPELTIPSAADDVAMAELPGIPAADMPDIFEI